MIRQLKSWACYLQTHGLSKTLDFGLLRAESKLRRLYHWHNKFGLPEALLWARQIDGWLRYNHVLAQLPTTQTPVTILELGAGPNGLSEMLCYTPNSKNYQLTITDIVPEYVEAVEIKPPVIAAIVVDGRELPFPDNSFDIAVSVDSLEHVPAESRKNYVLEMKRVARSKVVIHCPADNSKEFQGKKLDEQFQQWYIGKHGQADRNTAEHLICGHPDPELIAEWLPGASIRGTQNGNLWLKYMKNARVPISRFTTGLKYYFDGKNKEDQPPYHACLVVYDKKLDKTDLSLTKFDAQ